VIGKMAARERDAIFAANRAVGGIALSVALQDGHTRRKRVRESGPLRVRFPNSGSAEPQAVIVNTGGGIAGGDRLDLAFEVGPGAKLLVTSAAAEKVYRATGADSTVDLKLAIGAGGALSWLPQETILFDRVRLRRRIEIDLAESASLLFAEAIIFGRAAMNEAVTAGRVSDCWRVRREGRLIFADGILLDGAITQNLAAAAGANGGVAIATILAVPGDDDKIAAVRAISDTFNGEVGISGWNGIAVIRLCAMDGETLRRDLIAVLTALRTAPLPRLWLN
jgi:urease accessory protein